MKNAVVTGASTGIGKAISIELAKNGYFIFLIARDTTRLTQTKEAIEQNGGHADIIQTDLEQINSIYSMIESIKNKVNRIDLIANIAGVWHGEESVYANTDYDDFDPEVILNTMGVGIIAPMLIVHGLVSIMPETSRIINLFGTFENGAKGWLPYYVSKKAIEDFTVGLSEEYKERGIIVNGVSPSDTATEMYKKYFPEYVADSIEPELIASFVVDLCLGKVVADSGVVYVLKKNMKPFEAFHN